MLISVCVGAIRPHTLPYLVEAIRRQTHEDWELIIVPQGDDRELACYVRGAAAADSRIVAVPLDEYGRSRALNAGARAACGSVIAFTDDDCEPDPDWLHVLAECFRTRGDVGIVAGSCLAPPSRPHGRLSTCPSAYVSDYVYTPRTGDGGAPRGFYWIGANFAVRRCVLDAVGPFDQFLGVGSEFPAAEDTDYALRAEEKGVAQWTTPRAIVRHTYGVRVGLRNVLRHHRGYAAGSGAMLGKLELWEHRLADVWGREKPLGERVRQLVCTPTTFALRVYKRSYERRARERYLSAYTLGAQRLSVPIVRAN